MRNFVTLGDGKTLVGVSGNQKDGYFIEFAELEITKQIGENVIKEKVFKDTEITIHVKNIKALEVLQNCVNHLMCAMLANGVN